MVAVAILAGTIARQPPERVRMRDAFARPGSDHPFGADNLGRDVLSRVLHGTRPFAKRAFNLS
jgi:peptide/nickel transport system permease protein